ncbi:hypothetical protein JCM14469_42420 [Desulfatiferula olefinivorans]
MQSVMVDYDDAKGDITTRETAREEPWEAVCRRFNDDVHRLRDVTDMGKFTGLYRCYDDDNRQWYYMVEEDDTLYRLRHRHFLKKIGS